MQYSSSFLRRLCLACRTMARLRCTARLRGGRTRGRVRPRLRREHPLPRLHPPAPGTYLARERLQLLERSNRPVGREATAGSHPANRPFPGSGPLGVPALR